MPRSRTIVDQPTEELDAIDVPVPPGLYDHDLGPHPSGAQLEAWRDREAARSAVRRADQAARAPMRAAAFVVCVLLLAFMLGLMATLLATA